MQKQEGTTVALVSLGCPKNLVDAEVMLGVLAKTTGDISRERWKAAIEAVSKREFIDSNLKAFAKGFAQ